MLNKNWFSLVEVLISAVILSITVFGILRLTNNNTNQITVIEKNKEMYEVYYNTTECLKSFWYNYLSWITSTQSVNFWNDNTKCLTWIYNTDLTFSWITLKSYLDNQEVRWNEFWSYFTTSNWTNYINISSYITDWINTKNFEFKIYN